MKEILFVCTGNTCRSVMAAGLLSALLEREQMDDVYRVHSAGTSVSANMPASHNAVAALEELGVDLSWHRSRKVTKQMADSADLVLTMTNLQKQIILQLCPEAYYKVYTLTEYCNEGTTSDIADPFGGDIDDYINCRDEIMYNLVKLLDILKDRNKGDKKR